MEFGNDFIFIGIIVLIIGLSFFGAVVSNRLKDMFERRGKKGFLYWFLLIASYLFVYTAIIFFVCGRNVETTMSYWHSQYSLYVAIPLALFWIIIAFATRNVHYRYD